MASVPMRLDALMHGKITQGNVHGVETGSPPKRRVRLVAPIHASLLIIICPVTVMNAT